MYKVIEIFKQGDVVRFGNPGKKQTLARVAKVNRKTVLVTTLEPLNGHPKGTGFKVPVSIAKLATLDELASSGIEALAPMTLAEQRVAVPTAGYTFHKGQRVKFNDSHGREIIGTVRRVNRKTVTVDPIASHGSGYWRVSPSMLRAV